MSGDSSRHINDLTDAADAMMTAQGEDAAWLAAVALTQARGCNALNVVEMDAVSGQPLWFRSSMNEDWLEDYFQQQFQTVDPLLIGALAGQQTMRISDGISTVKQPATRLGDDLSDQLPEWGYRTLDTHIFRVRGASIIRGVTVSREDAGPNVEVFDKMLAAVISLHMSPAQTSESPGATPFQPVVLTPREQDVLSFLAAGLRNDAIAFRMNIAEVTVRAHIGSARRKLGAATREEAIAICIRAGLLRL